jgi:uncharacterized protein YheU (UPF0270 family)
MNGLEVPYTDLSPEALRGLIEHFVMSEGTDYGEGAFSLEEKVAAVEAQLKSGKAKIVFEPEEGTAFIVPKSAK